MKLVIPADHTPDSLSWISRNDRSLTWAEVAAAPGVTSIETLGSDWCVENNIDGLGFFDPAPVVPVPEIAPDYRVELLSRAEQATDIDSLRQILVDALSAGYI